MYRVIVDSSADMSAEFKEKYPATVAPFKLYIEDKEYIDDDTLDVEQFVEDFSASKVTPRSACPSPEDFRALFHPTEETYVVTISGKLSGTYNAAELAKKLYLMEHPEAKIHVIDSKAAASAESLLVRMVHDYKSQGMDYEQTMQAIDLFRDNMKCYFISESLDNLIKNGRISKLKAIIANTLHIIPIMGSDGTGEIKLYDKIRSANRAYKRLLEMVQEELSKGGKKIIAISHVSNWEKATSLMKEFCGWDGVAEVISSKCAGLSSLYADRKGIIVSF